MTVGSTIYHIENNHWHHIKEWDAEISNDWNGKSNNDLVLVANASNEVKETAFQCASMNNENESLYSKRRLFWHEWKL